VSCASPGNCAAGGYYTASGDHEQALLVVQRNGTWQKAAPLRGVLTLNAGGEARILGVSCARRADCAAVGYYEDHHHKNQALALGEKNGRWTVAAEIPGTASLNTGGYAEAESVSCTAAGDCSAGGFYARVTSTAAFVVTEASHVWGRAIEVPGSAALDKGDEETVGPLSCGSPGNCGAGGLYTDRSGHFQAMLVDETARRVG
jgi:hypothetical protein